MGRHPALGGASLPTGLAYTPLGGTTSTGYTVTSTAITQGAGPVTTASNNYTAWVNSFGSSYQPLVVLDLTQFPQFYSASCSGTPPNVTCTLPLVLTLRSTILGPDPNNQSEPFRCSAFNVPYSTAVYTNADGAGGGFMGPYVPLASYPTVSSLVSPSQPIGPSSLPSEASCAALSASSPSPFPSGNLASISQPSQWPVQLWGDTAEAPPYLNCGGGSSTFQPAIYYAGSQFTIEAVAANQPGYVAPPNFNTQSPCDYLDTYTPPNGNNAGTNSNPCMQVIQQVTENESTTTYQPPLPLTIVGTGFGYLSGLPRVVSPATSPQYIDAQEWTYPGPPSGQELWDSNSNSTGNCQVYITDWNDTGISLLLGLPPAAGAGGITNGEQQYLNPLTVMSPMSFFPKTSNVACPVTYGSVSQPNYLYVKVTNPQSNTAGAYVAVPIYSLGTACTLPNTNPGCPY